MMGNNPQQVPVEYQHAVAVPTPRPVSVPIAPQSFENRLKERLKGTRFGVFSCSCLTIKTI